MKDDGVVPKSKLAVTTINHTDGSTSLVVKGKQPGGDTPVFNSATVKPGDNVKSVTVTPHGADGKPNGASKTVTPSTPTTPTTVTFDAPTPAQYIIVVVHPTTPGKQATAELVSIVACMPEAGRLIGIGCT